MNPVRAHLGMGGNLGDVRATFAQALAAIEALQGTRVVAVSALYRSSPWGGVAQPDYLNAAVAIDTALSPVALLEGLQAIERAHGRDRTRELRWGARTLDLDVLTYGDQAVVIDAPLHVEIPHPRMLSRDFVVLPLLEIAPALQLPDGRLLREAWHSSPGAIIARLDLPFGPGAPR